MTFFVGDLVYRQGVEDLVLYEVASVAGVDDGAPVAIVPAGKHGELWDHARASHLRLAEKILQHFRYTHLPERLQVASKPFGELARQVVMVLPPNAERTVALRKLLEAKDAAVRALIEG